MDRRVEGRADGAQGGGPGDERMSAILGVAINGDEVRMALADAPVGGDAAVSGARRMRNVEEVDAAILLDGVPPHGTPEEQVAYALRPLFAGAGHPDGAGPAARRLGRQIRSVVFAYHDSDQAKRVTLATRAAGLVHYSLVPTPVAALAELMATRQVGFARNVAVCNVDAWRYGCGIVGADGAQVGDSQWVTTDKLAALDADVIEGLELVVDAAQRQAGVHADVVVVVGEAVEEKFAPEAVERGLGMPVIIPRSPHMLVARGASLLPSRTGGVAGVESASDGAAVAQRSRGAPAWMSSAAALAGIVGVILLAGIVVGGVAASGVFSTSDDAVDTSSDAVMRAGTPSPSPSPEPSPIPSPSPSPEPPTQAPPPQPQNPAPQNPVPQNPAPQNPAPQKPAPPPEPQTQAPPPQPQTQAPPQTRPQQPAQPQRPAQPQQPAPPQNPAPPPQQEIDIPGLPPIKIPNFFGP